MPKRNPPANPSDFGDLGPVTAAPDEPLPRRQEPPSPPPPVFVPPGPPPPAVVLSPEQMIAAIRGGDATGFPADHGHVPELGHDSSISLGRKTDLVTLGVAGHVLVGEVVTERRLVRWEVKGGGPEDLGHRWRVLTPPNPFASNGQMVTMEAGREFEDHHFSLDAIRAAGGVVVPVGRDA